MLDEQLKWIIRLLDEAGIDYWLDSGSLLGICRDQALIEGDNDIDLSIWHEDEPKLKALMAQIKASGYKVMAARFEGRPFKYKCQPRGRFNSRTIDFLIYRRLDGFAWAPQRGAGDGPYPEGSTRNVLYKVFRRLHSKFTRSSNIDLEAWPVSWFWQVRTWWIPEVMFDSRVDIRVGSEVLTVPERWMDYLTLRYGEWRTPDGSWSYWTDDGGLAHIHPSQRHSIVSA